MVADLDARDDVHGPTSSQQRRRPAMTAHRRARTGEQLVPQAQGRRGQVEAFAVVGAAAVVLVHRSVRDGDHRCRQGRRRRGPTGRSGRRRQRRRHDTSSSAYTSGSLDGEQPADGGEVAVRLRHAGHVPASAAPSPTATATPWGTCARLPRAWPMEWAIPVPPPSIATPARSAASCMARRTARSVPSSTAAGRLSSTIRTAWRPEARRPSRSRRRPLIASMAWTNASSPVAAVTEGGIVAVAAGSSTTTSGSSASPHVHTLAPRRSVTTHVRVTSAPVPAVVGMAIDGAPRRATVGAPARSARCRMAPKRSPPPAWRCRAPSRPRRRRPRRCPADRARIGAGGVRRTRRSSRRLAGRRRRALRQSPVAIPRELVAQPEPHSRRRRPPRRPR